MCLFIIHSLNCYLSSCFWCLLCVYDIFSYKGSLAPIIEKDICGNFFPFFTYLILTGTMHILTISPLYDITVDITKFGTVAIECNIFSVPFDAPWLKLWLFALECNNVESQQDVFFTNLLYLSVIASSYILWSWNWFITYSFFWVRNLLVSYMLFFRYSHNCSDHACECKICIYFRLQVDDG